MCFAPEKRSWINKDSMRTEKIKGYILFWNTNNSHGGSVLLESKPSQRCVCSTVGLGRALTHKKGSSRFLNEPPKPEGRLGSRTSRVRGLAGLVDSEHDQSLTSGLPVDKAMAAMVTGEIRFTRREKEKIYGRCG